MLRWFADISVSIGDTPPIRVDRVADGAGGTLTGVSRVIRKPADSGERDISEGRFDGLLDEKGLAV